MDETRRILAALPPAQAKALLCLAAALSSPDTTLIDALQRACAALQEMKGAPS